MKILFLALLLIPSIAHSFDVESAPNVNTVTGTLSVANGGTGGATLTDNAVLVGNGTVAVHASTSVVILATGNTGVGTVGPTKLLEVNGAIQANGAATFNTSVTISSAAAGTVFSATSGGIVVASMTAIGVFGPVNGPEVIAAAAVITADSCSGLKRLSTGGAVTTNTTNTFTAPAAANRGCCMKLFLDPGAGGNLVLDANANFNTLAGTDVTMTTCDMVEVCSDGVDWTQASPIQVNTCN